MLNILRWSLTQLLKLKAIEVDELDTGTSLVKEGSVIT